MKNLFFIGLTIINALVFASCSDIKDADNYINGFKGLKMIGYNNYVSFECGCQGDRNVVVPAAVKLLREQWEQA